MTFAAVQGEEVDFLCSNIQISEEGFAGGGDTAEKREITKKLNEEPGEIAPDRKPPYPYELTSCADYPTTIQHRQHRKNL